jgi:hypothetical protein
MRPEKNNPVLKRVALTLLVALCSTSFILVFSGLIPKWGCWYSVDHYYRMQTEAFLKGHLALSNDPRDLDQDLCWSEGGVHQVWGLAIPAWRLPFEAVAKWQGYSAFPDRLALVILIALLGYLVPASFAVWVPRQGSGEFSSLLKGYGIVLLLLLFPPFLSLLSGVVGIYKEVLAYAYLYGLLLVCSLAWLTRRPDWVRYWVACALAGIGGMLRPTFLSYSVAALIMATAIMWHSFHQQTGGEPAEGKLRRGARWKLATGVGLFMVGMATLWWTNVVRFGDGLEFGHQLNLQGGQLLRSVYVTRFPPPFHNESLWRAARELFGALFLARDFNSDWYAPHIFPGQSPILRWREFSFTTYDLSVLFLVGSGWVAGICAGLRWWRKRLQLSLTLDVVLTGWSFLAALVLALFYLKSPVIASRYMMDFSPAFAVAIVVAWSWFSETVHQKLSGSRGRSTHVGLFVLLIAWLMVQIAFSRTAAQTTSLNWEKVVLEKEKRKVLQAEVSNLPSRYQLGDEMSHWGIPFNGAGWDQPGGNVDVCVILFVDSPEFLELTLMPAAGAQVGRTEVENIQAKVGLEFLKLETIEHDGEFWRVRFSAPSNKRYQAGLQPVFIATVPKTRLAEVANCWRLAKVSWH